MGGVYNTTDVIDNSIFLKANLYKNMVGENYYIENIQDKRNQDWYLRYNVVDIEEELNKQITYTNKDPKYTAIESVIDHVKSPTGEDMSDDWARLAFRDLKHPCGVGYRYRFNVDFQNTKLTEMTEEEKHYGTSIWIAINKSHVKAGNSCIVRRCNTALTMVSDTDPQEIHLEPTVLENDLKYMQIYYNLSLPVPQAEWYATMQLNYFSNHIKINDRFIFGVTNPEDRDNNQTYKVKAVIKSTTDHTFIRDHEDEMNSTKLVIIALDKCELSPKDDFVNRVAEGGTVYHIGAITPDPDVDHEYDLRVEEPYDSRILMNDTYDYEFNLYDKGALVSGTVFTINAQLENCDPVDYNKYFEFAQVGDNQCMVHNLKVYNKGKLVITVACPEMTKEFKLTLGGFY